MRTTFKGFGLIHIMIFVVIIVAVVIAIILTYGPVRSSDESPAPAATNSTPRGQNVSEAEIISAPAEKKQFSALPGKLQDFIKSEVQNRTPSCLKDGKLVDSNGNPINPEASYAPVGSAIVPLGCEDKSIVLFAQNKNGNWTYVESTNGYFSCDAIFHNPVPKKLIQLATPTAECYDKASDTVMSYDEAAHKRFY